MKTWQEFAVGDVVSRLGDDEQVIVGINDLGDMLELRCIKSDHNEVFKVGDTECNCADVYEYIRSPNAGSDASASPPIASTGLVGTDTPRTDAVSMRGDCDRHAANGACLCVDLLNMAEHARQLERELNALRANNGSTGQEPA